MGKRSLQVNEVVKNEQEAAIQIKGLQRTKTNKKRGKINAKKKQSELETSENRKTNILWFYLAGGVVFLIIFFK